MLLCRRERCATMIGNSLVVWVKNIVISAILGQICVISTMHYNGQV